MFRVKSKKTDLFVGGTYKTRQAARKAADKRDNDYGAYVHMVVDVDLYNQEAQYAMSKTNG